jgi:hypothetical protein
MGVYCISNKDYTKLAEPCCLNKNLGIAWYLPVALRSDQHRTDCELSEYDLHLVEPPSP